MSTPALLSEYESLAGSAVTLMNEENRHLRATGTVPDQELLRRKRSLLDGLEEKLTRLRQAGGSGAGWPASELAALQQRFLQIIRLDRENEKLLLAALSSTPVQSVAATSPVDTGEEDGGGGDHRRSDTPGRWRRVARFLSQ